MFEKHVCRISIGRLFHSRSYRTSGCSRRARERTARNSKEARGVPLAPRVLPVTQVTLVRKVQLVSQGNEEVRV